MWLWQQNKAKTVLVMRIASITFVLHGCVMGLLFFMCGHSALSFTVSTRKLLEDQRIIIVPFYKKTMGSIGKAAAHRRTNVQMPAKTKKTDAQKTGIKSCKKTTKPAVKKQSNHKNKTSMLKKDLSKKEKKIEQHSKKVSPEPDIKTVPSPELDKKTEPVVDKQLQHEPIAANEPLAQDNAVYMQQDEYDALVLYEQIQRELIRCWSPPAGIAAGTQCVVTLYVTWQGLLERYTLQQSSGILMFDMSVRASLKDIVFPRVAYGKELTITFMQETELCR
jgi:outer membrane biosynthesis protein TonB